MRRYLYAAGVLLLLGLLVTAVFAPQLAPHDPYAADITAKYLKPSAQYPLGTDYLGRCTASRMIWGVRPTLGYALLTMGLTISVGTLMGVVSGYFGGWADSVLSFVIQLLLSIPSQIMIFVIVALVGNSMLTVVIAMAAIKWAWYAKMVRDEVISLSGLPYVQFAEITGAPPLQVLKRHILPNLLPYLAVLASLNLSWSLLNLTALSFLGFGIAPPAAEWGAMLNEARQVMLIHPEQMVFPGVAITLTAAAIHLAGDALNEMLLVKEPLHE